MTKIAVITANVGGIDTIKGIPRQTQEIDFHYYTDNNLPFPLPNLNNRLKSKYLKTQTHRFLPDYDLYIWIDGSVSVNGQNFAEEFLNYSKDVDVAIYKHKDRKTPYDEISYIVECMMKGNSYLLSRYGDQQILKEALFCKEKGMPDSVLLFNCFVFARWNNKKVNEAFDEWWKLCLEFSNFDQAMFSYATWSNDLKINALQHDDLRTHKLFTRGSHIGDQQEEENESKS